jgi:uncharacterized membrane protein (DUF106 family)
VQMNKMDIEQDNEELLKMASKRMDIEQGNEELLKMAGRRMDIEEVKELGLRDNKV